MLRRMVPLVIAIVLVLGCKKKAEDGAGTANDGTVDSDPGASYTIKIREEQVGEKYDVTSSDTASNDITIGTNNDKSVQQSKFEYTIHILEMSAGTKLPAKMTRTYKVAQRTDPKTKQLTALPFEGKTVTIEKKGAEYQFSIDGKRMSAADALILTAEFRNPEKGNIAALLPKQPVKVGESWAMDPQTAKTIFGGPGSNVDVAQSKFNCKLARAYTKDGKQWGAIAFDFELVIADAKGKTGGSGTAKVEGTFDTVIDGSAREGTMNGTVKGTLTGPGLKVVIDETNTKSVKPAK